ncbi:hypothetical protein LTR17_001052 [Elasticomyces elasticus]|nr:hypothetical protein LTR17_001052 [Elasticomyces elasticus]
MAHTVTLEEGQLQQLLRLACTENERLLNEAQVLKVAASPSQDEKDALKAENQALRNESEDLKSQVRTLNGKLRKLEDHISRTETTDIRAPTTDLRPTPDGLDPAPLACVRSIERTIKREVVEIESDDEAIKREVKKRRSESTNGTVFDPIKSENTTIQLTSNVRSNSEETEGMPERRDEPASPTAVLALNDQGEPFVLSAGEQPRGLRAVIARTEELLTETFNKKPNVKEQDSWQSAAITARTIQCIRAFCNGGGYNSCRALKDSKHAACQKCFNARELCFRYDADEPSRGIHVVPLPLATRPGIARDALAYYIYPEQKAQRKVEKAGKIWIPRTDSKAGGQVRSAGKDVGVV